MQGYSRNIVKMVAFKQKTMCLRFLELKDSKIKDLADCTTFFNEIISALNNYHWYHDFTQIMVIVSQDPSIMPMPNYFKTKLSRLYVLFVYY